MFESKVSSRSAWGEMTSINSSSAPGFVPIPCPSHPQYSITNICKAPNCIQPLCPECIANHVQLHQENKKPAKIENIITTRITCIEQLAKMKYDAQKQIEQCVGSSAGNIEQFVEAHQKRLDTAYKKLIKMVDDMFTEMNKQMQVISNAYLAEKEKKERQVRMKLSPMNDFLISITDYKQELQSDDYIPALIELLHEPPRKPKYEQPSEGQNFGSVEINEKCLEDIKNNISKFVHVVVNCKDEGFKARVQMNKSNAGGSNNMKFSRFDRQRSRDGSDSKIFESRRSNSKKKIFGCESVISEIKPNSSSRIEVNSIYQGLNQHQASSKFYPNQQKGTQQIKYSSYSTPLKISKHSYFTHNNVSLWYFKGGSKNAFRAPLQSIQAGFERVDLNINFNLPENHRSLILTDGTTLILGGQNGKDETTTNKAYYLHENDLTLREISPMIKTRSLFGVCFAHESVFVAGGVSCQINKWTNRKVLADAQKYNLREKRWQKIASLPQPSCDFSMHALGGKIIKFGGLTESRNFLHKIDIYQIFKNSWASFQVDDRFVLTKEPGITQISGQSLLVFGGLALPENAKTSKCYQISQEQTNGSLVISEGPQLYNEATFESAFVHEGYILAIQNNEVVNRNKLIMGYKYNQWKFISC